MIVYLMSLAMTAGGFAARAAGDAKAEQLMAQARAALGGEKNLSKVQGLTATGTYQRTMADRQVGGEVTIDLQLPDKLLRTESMSPMGDILIVTGQGLNGDRLLRNQRTLNGPPGVVIRTPSAPTGDAEAAGDPQRARRSRAHRPGVPARVAGVAAARVQRRRRGRVRRGQGRRRRRERRRQLRGAHSARSENPSPADAHLSRRRAAHGDPDAAGAAAEGGRGRGERPHDMPDAPAPQIVDITLYLDDYKAVDGVMLPHHMARSIDGKPAEETTFKTIKLNPAFKPDTFAAK